MKKETVKLGKLVMRAQKGERAALRELIEHTETRLFRFCYYLTGNKASAEDIAQDAFVRVLEEISSLKDPEAFQSWLFRTAKNRYLDFAKSAKNRGHVPLEEVPEPEDSPDLPGILKIREALAGLDEADRPLVLLADLEGYSYKEIAEIIGISKSATRSRLHRARQQFLKIFQKD